MKPPKYPKLLEAGLGCSSVFLLLLALLPIGMVLGVVQIALIAVHVAGSADLFAGGLFDTDAWFFDPTTFDLLGGTLIPAWILVASTTLQNAGLLTAAVFLVGLVSVLRNITAESGTRIARYKADFRNAFPFRVTPGAILAAAVVGGFSVGMLADFLSSAVRDRWPDLDASSAELINQAFVSASTWQLVLLIPTIALIVPVAEELLFRGYLYDAFERWLPGPVVVLLTALAFALVHGSPLHIIGVLPLGLFQGWLRYTTGSLWAPIAVHVVNNSLASVAILYLTTHGDLDDPLATLSSPIVAGIAGPVALAMCGLAWWMRGGPAHELATEDPDVSDEPVLSEEDEETEVVG